jgi:hypothetical protein
LTAGRRSPPCSGSRPREPHDEAASPQLSPCFGFESGGEDPGATLHGLASYQGEADPLVEATARSLNAPISAVALPFALGDAEALRALLSAAGFQRIAITPQSLRANFPLPERFVQLTVLGSAATVPTFAQLDTAARAALVEAVTLESEATVHHYCEGDRLIFPMSTHIAVAYT